MNEGKELVAVNPGEMFRVATDVAGVCREIVQKTAVNIQGKKYVRAEGWNAIAAAHGCAAGIREVEVIPDAGTRAVAELKRLSDGMIIATAEGFVGTDESKWATGPEYARRAMAQTRAISRVCRTAFAHVVVLIDSNLSTTPADEVPENGFTNSGGTKFAKTTVAEAKVVNTMHEDKGKPLPQQSGDWRDCILHFTKNAGKTLGELTDKQISWYYEEWMPKRKSEVEAPNPKWPLTQKDQNLFDALEGWHMTKTKDKATSDKWQEEEAKERKEMAESEIPF